MMKIYCKFSSHIFHMTEFVTDALSINFFNFKLQFTGDGSSLGSFVFLEGQVIRIKRSHKLRMEIKEIEISLSIIPASS